MIKTSFNASAAQAAVRNAIAQMKDATPLFQEIVEYMIQATRERFVTGTGPDGKKWAAKKQSTLDRYKRLGYGNLNKALIGPGRSLSRQVIGAASAKGAVIGSNMIYSRVMQEGAEKGAFGTDRRGNPLPWGRIPARVWLGVSAKDERQIIAISGEYLEQALDTGA
ncbi:MAG: phage virion morphogenesis protein [Novosphingobium sp.]|nr:phage virion morphogenesis protein [Novosphingobium sp.]